MHTQHLIGRVKQIQTDLRSVSDDLQLRGHTVQAEELRREAKSMEGLLLTLRADLTAERARAADSYSGVRLKTPNDAELERRTGEPHIDGWPLQSGLPPPAKTMSQKMREAGYTRRPTWRSLPSDE